MLRGIRRASANWLGKVVMGVVVSILVVSFAIWGIGDIFRGFGRSSLASVGSTEISVEQFRQIYTERLQQIAAQRGRPIPPDQARALGLDRLILGVLISETALDEWARRLGLGITDAEVARHIREYPAFHGPGGQFDPDLFIQRIRSAGYTEARFVAEQRRLLIRQHLTDAVSAVAVTPKTFADAQNTYQNEQRSIEYVTLGREQAGEIPQPTPEQIASYFETRKVAFRAPEYRRVVLLRLTRDDIAKWLEISDADLRRAYEERRTRYVTAGRRQLQQIVFPTEDEAKAAKQRIDAGASFEEIARERGLSESDIDLGLVTRTAFQGPLGAAAVGEAAFSLSEGGVSAPVQGRSGFVLVRVVKIEPERVRTFEEAAPEIKEELARERTRAELNEKHDKIEDERAGGQSLLEAAQKVGLTATVIEAVDRSGRDPSGAVVPALPSDVDVLTPAFSTDVGVEADPLRLADNGYLWFEVAGITPAKERSLEEVKDRVEARWRDDQVAERLKAKASEMLDRLKAGTTLQELAAAENIKTETASELRRTGQAPGLSPSGLAEVFRTPQGSASTAEGAGPAERTVFRVTQITVPPLDDAQTARIGEAVRGQLAEDLIRQYVVQVERELGTHINTDALRRVAGGESS